MISKPMLHEDTSIQPIRYKGGAGVSTSDIKQLIEQACIEHGLNVIVSTDVVTSGRIFDRSQIECVVIKNAEHQTDYFHEVVTVQSQGIYAFMNFYYTGTSKNNRRIAAGKSEHSTIAGSIIGAIKKATVSNDAMDAENMYYTMLADAINAVFI